MAKAITDPELLNEFAAALERYRQQSDELRTRLKSRIADLGRSWSDSQYQRFVEDFAEADAQLESFRRILDDELPRFRTMAVRARAAQDAKRS